MGNPCHSAAEPIPQPVTLGALQTPVTVLERQARSEDSPNTVRAVAASRRRHPSPKGQLCWRTRPGNRKSWILQTSSLPWAETYAERAQTSSASTVSRQLHGTSYEIIPDRLEAGTFLLAAAATGGRVTVEPVIPEHLRVLLAKLEAAGALITMTTDSVRSTPQSG